MHKACETPLKGAFEKRKDASCAEKAKPISMLPNWYSAFCAAKAGGKYRFEFQYVPESRAMASVLCLRMPKAKKTDPRIPRQAEISCTTIIGDIERAPSPGFIV